MSVSILIVEDEWLIAEDHAAVLRAADHRVVGPCADVKSAVDAIDRETVDMGFLDIELRREKSFAVADRLKELNIPFTFVSGHGRQNLPPELSNEEVLSKPVERGALLAAVERMSRRDQG